MLNIHSQVGCQFKKLFSNKHPSAGNQTQSTGIYSQTPKYIPAGYDWKFRETLTLGTIGKSKSEFKAIVHELKSSFPANSYHLTGKNCNHFCEALCQRLEVPFPAWVNRVARVGESIRQTLGTQWPTQQATPTPASQAAPVSPLETDVTGLIDSKKCACLNATHASDVLKLFQEHNAVALQSDAVLFE